MHDAFVDAAGQYFTDLFQRIPVILRFSGLNSSLEGFCCFNNVVAVREEIAAHHQDSPNLRVHFANLVGHEVQHGILRRFFNRMDVSAPFGLDLLIQESGRAPREKRVARSASTLESSTIPSCRNRPGAENCRRFCQSAASAPTRVPSVHLGGGAHVCWCQSEPDLQS